MQKLLRRSELAKRQAIRKATVRKSKLASDEAKSRRNETIELERTIIKDIRNERFARRQDWQLGHLAPRRDVGAASRTYGALDSRRTQGIEKANWKDYLIREGDRVVIITKGHRDRGKIGVVTEIREEKEECLIEDMNQAYITIPEHMLASESDKTPFRPYPLPMPLSEVRLVAKLPYPETGVLRDVVINELQKGKIPPEEFEEHIPEDKLEDGRYIAGLSPRTFLPWPEKEREEFDEHECDTLRIDVEETTFTPTLHEPPMPLQIIDELRNKFSKFRTRHDDEYIEKIKAKDREQREKKEILKLKMITPMQELKMKEKARKEAEPEPELDPSTLSYIGEVMKRNRTSRAPAAAASASA